MKLKHSIFPVLLTPAVAMGSYFERVDQQLPNSMARHDIQTLHSSKSTSANSALAMVKQVKSNKTNTLHTRYQQTVNGLPIWKAETTLHEGQQTHMLGQLLKDFDVKKIKSSVFSEKDVIAHSIKIVSEKNQLVSDSDIKKTNIKKYLYREKSGRLVEAFLVDMLVLNDKVATRPQMMIRGADLLLLESWDGLQFADVHGTGPGGNVKTGRYEYGTDFPAFIVEENNNNCVMENVNVKAVNLNHAEDESIVDAFSYECALEKLYRNDFKEINGAFSPINDAFYFGNLVFEMYDQWYETAPLPMQLSMKVHYGNQYENAFWTGEAMYFGDGDTFFYPLVDVNVSAHEVSHGFTEFNSGLIYSGESGGMNEAFSDIAGEAAEYFMKDSVDWLVGSDIMQEAEALRFFKDPSLDGKSIGHTDEYTDGLNVHYSSGIYNKAFYHLSETQNWNVRKAFDVFVYANQHYWIADETFEGGLCGLLMSAAVLDYNQDDIRNAFNEVGVECNKLIDADGDKMFRDWEILHGFNDESAHDAELDFDNDGLTNFVESQTKTNPKYNDSDFDGLLDGREIELGLNPLNADFDGDGMSDGYEIQHGLNPKEDDSEKDFDGDKLSNILEYSLGLSPSKKDTWIPGQDLLDINEGFEAELSQKWISTAENTWSITDQEYDRGAYSLVSDDISDNEYAQIDIQVLAHAGDIMRFKLKTSTESGYDFFILAIDGFVELNESGITDWQSVMYEFKKTGLQTVSFVYQKDSSVSGGSDQVWIDELRFAGGKDGDENGLPDFWQTFYGVVYADADDDRDGLRNIEEYRFGTSPVMMDSDQDNLSDFDEINTHGTQANLQDSDADGLPDGVEVSYGLNPLLAADAHLDMDGDRFTNIEEYLYGGRLDRRFSLPKFQFMWIESFLGRSLNGAWTHELPSTQNFVIPSSSEFSAAAWELNDRRLQSQAIGNGMEAVMHYTNLFKAGTLWFDLKPDTDVNKDEFILYMDGKEVLRQSGVYESRMKVRIETAGIHTFTFKYVKDASGSTEADKVAVDNFFFIAH